MLSFFIPIEYYMVIQNTLSNYNPKCSSYIREATLTISDLLKTNDGARYIDKKFKYVIYNILY